MRFVLGTAQFGFDYGINNLDGKIPKKEVFRILKYAWKNKIRILDTAAGYGESEKIIGEFINKYKLHFRIITGEFPQCTAKNLEKGFLISLKNLNQEKVSGYLIHNFDHFLKDEKIWQSLEKLKAEGRIEKIGFSLYYPDQLKLIFKKNIKPDIIQIPYSFFDQRFAEHLPLLKKKSIRIYARSVFLQGLIFKKLASLENKFLKIKDKLIFLQRISQKAGIPLSALAINFACLNEHIDKIVVGVDSLKNLQENLKGLRYKNKVKKIYPQLLSLKEDEEKLILPINW